MLSAFGVDHGEVSKGLLPKVMPSSKLGARAARARRAAGAVRGPTTAPLTAPKSGGQKIKGALNRAGEADISLKGIGQAAGRGVRGVGGFMEKRPGLTGTALVGGGGAAGYKYLSDKQPRKR